MERQSHCPELIAPSKPTSLPLWLIETSAWIDRLYDRLELMRSRRQLRGLSDELLHDIGVSRCDAEREASKPFWKN